MTIANPYMGPGSNPSGAVQNVSNNQLSDTSGSITAFGRQGDTLVSDVHGRYYASGSRGNLYVGTSGVAGSAPLAPGQTTGGFILFNPPASGVYVEAHQLRISTGSTATVVVAGYALEGSVQTPTGTLTGCTVSSMPLGAGNLGALTAAASAKARVYGVATIAAMTYIGNLGNAVSATTSTAALIDFNGSLVLAPGMCINLVTSISNTGKIILCDWVWSEWLP